MGAISEHGVACRTCRFLTAAMLLPLLYNVSVAEEYFDRYGLTPASPSVDLGIQPLGYPSGVISAVMRHDRILKRTLAESTQPLATHPFKRGADMLVLLADARLEAGLLGDLPTIGAASLGSVWIVGLVKQTSTAIVARDALHVSALAGKRVGYVEASSAHYTLLQGIASAGLGENQVQLVPLSVDEMPGALERGDIDAFAAWEPAPSIARANSEKNRIIFRGQSTDYFVIGRDFARRSPETAQQLVAGFLRAIEWMRRSPSNVEKAALWAMEDSAALSGKPETLSVAQIVSITQREILSIPSAPSIVFSPGTPPLKNEFDFLMKRGKLPAGATWENVESALGYDGLVRVLTNPGEFRTGSFDYDNP